jgi:hypothetical protein
MEGVCEQGGRQGPRSLGAASRGRERDGGQARRALEKAGAV